MDEDESGIDLEVEALDREYRWVLRNEVQHAITFLLSVLQECKTRLPTTSADANVPLQEERFIMNPANGGDFLKCVVGLMGNRVTKADVTFKVIGKNPAQMMKFGIPPEAPYLLQQFQDAYNCVSESLTHLSIRDADYDYQTAEEVIKLIEPVVVYLTHARTVLIVPKKRSFEELRAAAHRRHFVPPLPADMSASLYIQAHKLIFALYQVLPGSTKFDCYQAEVSIPWLTEALVLMTVALQTCQQLLDKMNIFVQNLDLNQKPAD